MTYKKLNVQTKGEGFYDVTRELRTMAKELFLNKSGMIHLFITHTSAGLTINESFDPSARIDLENFLKHIAPRNLDFITHTDEGEDDSPSHMKAILMNQNLGIIVEKGELILGTWQGVYLCEFRDDPKTRSILVKPFFD